MKAYQYIKISSEAAMNTPSEVVYTDENFIVSKSLIPSTYTEAKVCFFIDTENDSYGSVASLEDAVERIKMVRNNVKREDFFKITC